MITTRKRKTFFATATVGAALVAEAAEENASVSFSSWGTGNIRTTEDNEL
jgi:hypothetical protein